MTNQTDECKHCGKTMANHRVRDNEGVIEQTTFEPRAVSDNEAVGALTRLEHKIDRDSWEKVEDEIQTLRKALKSHQPTNNAEALDWRNDPELDIPEHAQKILKSMHESETRTEALDMPYVQEIAQMQSGLSDAGKIHNERQALTSQQGLDDKQSRELIRYHGLEEAMSEALEEGDPDKLWYIFESYIDINRTPPVNGKD